MSLHHESSSPPSHILLHPSSFLPTHHRPQRRFTTSSLDCKMADSSRKRASSERPRPLISHNEDQSQSPCPTPNRHSTEQKAGSFSSPTLHYSDSQYSDSPSPHYILHHKKNGPEVQASFYTPCHASSTPRFDYNTEACLHSDHFPANHHLDPTFVQYYQLEDELGSGGYGFVMTAYHRMEGHEVAVKFIIKDKVPEHAWTEDPMVGRLPTEVVLISGINHPNIVKCLDLFEDNLFFYLVRRITQEF